MEGKYSRLNESVKSFEFMYDNSIPQGLGPHFELVVQKYRERFLENFQTLLSPNPFLPAGIEQILLFCWYKVKGCRQGCYLIDYKVNDVSKLSTLVALFIYGRC